MPRAKKGDKFFMQKLGASKGRHLIGLRAESANLQDLLDFLKEKNINPAKVDIPSTFITQAG